MSKLGIGPAKAITPGQLAAIADSMGVHPAALAAIAEVESGGFGWFRDGRMKILFEKHWFYKYVSGDTRKEAVQKGLARRAWVSPKNGGYKDQQTADQRYALLAQAMRLNAEGAFRSISMGTYQIMGFNHEIVGYASAQAMFEDFLTGEAAQLRAFARFLSKKKLIPAIRRLDFDRVETVYNGGGLGGAYAQRMREAYDRLYHGEWAHYKPGDRRSIPVDKPEPKADNTGTLAGWLAALFNALLSLFRR